MTMADPKPQEFTQEPPPGPDDGLAQPAEVPRGGWRHRLRTQPGLGQAYRIAVFLLGLFFIVCGLVLAVLPGPLTIPPVLLGLWIWSKEFSFAQKLFDSFKRRAREAREHSRQHPVSSTLITVAGLAAAGAAIWAVSHFQLVDRAQSLMGF